MCRPKSHPRGGYQCKDPNSIAAAAAGELQAYIGATPFRPESAELLSLDSRPNYYSSEEWREYDDTIRNAGASHDIELLDDKPADGLWEGETEPAGAYTARGSEECIRSWAAEIAGRYNQDSVMVAFVDETGPDRMYTFGGETNIDAEDALDTLRLAGIPGGRVVDGRLQILQTDGQPDKLALYAIQRRYGSPEWTPVRAEFVVKNTDYARHAPIREIQKIRQDYRERHGFTARTEMPHMSDLDDIAAAKAYGEAVHDPRDPAVRRSYRSLGKHVQDQYSDFVAAGFSFEPWESASSEQPYADSAEMLADLRESKHLFYFRTEVSDETEGALPAGHPMARTITVPDGRGGSRHVPLNDAFRAVHDAIAHGDGLMFGPEGERRAWWTHRTSLPKEARLALFCETRGQNTWTNAGPHMRDGDRVLRRGEHGWLAQPERPYAVQKAARIPKGLC
ncbi:hypothetical protein [Paenarthrobacter nitroguajacolicus]|mgnify:CR=1 FL=1|uniref:hypothetical protein n=1 Tax=Paenarthrobacter nitroguajacolicus TaxID=211146 RepID=UPI0015C010C0|nr:hypothetical protein [Paenarthrobacter nitroguajacolicus]NWL32023.1 hypothetical protein [Paenarthrobacter nitroguajacolicus]